jgi:MFS family permease
MSAAAEGSAGFAARHKVALGFAGGIIAILFGAAAGYALGYEEQAVASGLISLFVVGTALAVPAPVSYKAAIGIGLVATFGLLIAELTTGSPIAAGIAMGVVSLLMSLGRAGGKRSFVIGLVLGTGYFLPATLGLVDGINGEDVGEIGLAGIVAGLVLALGVSTLHRLVGPGNATSKKAEAPAKSEPALPKMWAELRRLGPDARTGIRRGLLLGIVMGLYQVDGDVNLFWILLTINLILQPDPTASVNRALSRSTGAVVGALLVGVLSQVIPGTAMILLGVLAVAFGLSWYRKDYTVYAACVTFLAVSIYGADTGSFWEWAGLRAIDTLIGAAIAIASIYLIFPEQKRAKES